MKNMKSILFLALAFGTLSSCTEEDAYEIPTFKSTIFQENFSDNTDNTDLNTTGWTNYAQQGTKKWSEQVFSDNGYAEFTSFGSAQAVNIAWLISPEIDMDKQEGEKLHFQTAHNFLTHRDNPIELLVSTDYDGVNFNNASWVKLDAKMVTPDDVRFTWINSGAIDLSKFTGKLHFAFRVTGSGTNTNLDGTYQVDNIRVFN